MPTKKIYDVIIADDHPLILMGLEQAMAKIRCLRVKAKGQNGQEAYDAILKWKPDFAILDIQMPEMTGLEIAEKLCNSGCETKIVLLTMFHDLSLFEKAKQLGVKAYLLKDSMLNEIDQCIAALVQGQDYMSNTSEKLHAEIQKRQGPAEKLSRMEKKVFQLISENKTTKEIAELLFLSPKTIENHRYNICKKLHIGGGANALLKFALEHKS